MKIVYFSDTHRRHRELVLPVGDILIFGGDMSVNGSKEEILDFLTWFNSTKFQYKIFIAGNHDIGLDTDKGVIDYEISKFLENYLRYDAINFYLNNSGCEIEGIKFWGSPYTPRFRGDKWAFTSMRGSGMFEHWCKIPKSTDVLITHGPPANRRDYIGKGQKVGCIQLAEAVDNVKPDLHLFGHIHEDAGIEISKYTTFINGSICRNDSNEIRDVYYIDYNTGMRSMNIIEF